MLSHARPRSMRLAAPAATAVTASHSASAICRWSRSLRSTGSKSSYRAVGSPAAAAAAAIRRCLHSSLHRRADDGAKSDSAVTSSDSADSSSASDALPGPSPPLPFAVVGSGPAAFYTAKYLLRDLPQAVVHMYERLPVPGGLVRFGVAPDHPDVKQVSNDFAQVMNHARFAFFGNVEVGRDVGVNELRKHYAGVILAYGAASERTLSIPGSQLKGIHPSRHFVNWYNSHPEHSDHSFELHRVKQAVIVGQGNVALDCARILLARHERLKPTDIAGHALEHLSSSAVQRVHMLGRRGAVQSAFSIGEFRELATSVEGVAVKLHPDEMARSENEASLKEVAESRPKKRRHELMRSLATDAATPHDHKELHVRYFLAPKEFLPDPSDPTRVGSVVLDRMELRGIAEQQEAVPTGETVTIEAGLVLTSIGYKSLPIPDVPFDSKKHIVPSTAGRVHTLQNESLPGVYVAGWLKRGPSGIIATNIMDARETVKSIIEDVKAGVVKEPLIIPQHLPFLSPESFAANRLVDRKAWSKIDSHEQSQGLKHGKPRVKLPRVADLLAIAHSPDPASGIE